MKNISNLISRIFPPWSLILVVIITILSGAIVEIFKIVYKETASIAVPQTPTTKVPLKTWTIGSTKAQVREAEGPPRVISFDTSDKNNTTENWYYFQGPEVDGFKDTDDDNTSMDAIYFNADGVCSYKNRSGTLHVR